MTDLAKIIDSKKLSLDEYLELLFSEKYPNLFPNNCIPTDKMMDELIEKIDSFSETQMKNLLRKFLIHNCTLGKDDFTAQWLEKELKKEKNVEKILSFEYYRKVLIASTNPNYLVWEGLTWVLDLLPHSPKEALRVIDAYFYANCQFLPDYWLNGLSDCSTIIRARYIQYKHNQQIFFDISPLDFEKVIGSLYEELGYDVTLTKASYDNGIDILATKHKTSKKEKILIQCKRLTTKKVGVHEVRALLGVVSSDKSTKGVLVTSTEFTKEAQKLSAENPRLELINYKELTELLNANFGPNWINKIDRITKKDNSIISLFE